VEGSGRDIMWSTASGLACELEKPRKDHTIHAVCGFRYELRTFQIWNESASHSTAMLGLCSWNSVLIQPKNRNSVRISNESIFIKRSNWFWFKILRCPSSSLFSLPQDFLQKVSAHVSRYHVLCVCVCVCVSYYFLNQMSDIHEM